jgi:hypothetical protein
MKKNNMILTGLLAAIVIFGCIVTYRNQSNKTMTICAARAEKDEKRNSLLRQIDKNQSAMDRATNEGQKERLAKQAEKLQSKLNNLQ